MLFDLGPRRLGAPLAARLWACGAIVSAGVLSCGGLAADGREPEGGGPREAAPVGGPSPVRPVRETCADNPLLAGCTGATPVRPVRETCEDNPLLAGCPGVTPVTPVRETCADNPFLAGCPNLEGAVPDEEPLYVAAARNILSANCGACHSSVLTEAQASDAINYIDDWQKLNQNGLIDECSPESSRIIEVMRTGEMPPPGSGQPPVSDLDIEVVASAIELDCRRK